MWIILRNGVIILSADLISWLTWLPSDIVPFVLLVIIPSAGHEALKVILHLQFLFSSLLNRLNLSSQSEYISDLARLLN